MSWLYGQTWLWYLIAFLVGVLLAWLMFVLPQRRRLRALEAHEATPTGRRSTASVDDAVTERIPPVASASNPRAGLDEADDPTTELPAVPAATATTVGSPAPGSRAATPEDPTVTIGRSPAPDGPPEPEDPTVEVDTGAGATALGVAGLAATDTRPVDPAADPTAGAPVTAPAGATIPPSTGAAQASAGGPEPAHARAPAAQALVVEPAAASFEPGPYPGSALPEADGSAPTEAFTIKGNADSMLYHTPMSPYFRRTKAEAWFATAEDAEAAGFTAWTRK